METRSTVPFEAVKAHNRAVDCWIVIDEKVWDVTDFLAVHPGGPDGKYLEAHANTHLMCP